MFSREKKTPLAEWWWTIDRQILGALILLLAAGVALSFAASPAVAERIGKSSWHFIFRHLFFLIPTIIVLIATSFATPRLARFAALIMLIGSLGLLILTPFIGYEANGAKRWILIFGQSIQPSEFVKPAFAIIAAWLIAQKLQYGNVPGVLLASLLMVIIIIPMLLQPDIGQTFLILATWSALVFLSGVSLWIVLILFGGIVSFSFAAYLFFPHVTTRFNSFIDSFLNPASGASYQVEKAMRSLMEGGWFGRGPGEAIAKRYLPDAHADYVFAAAAGEFGILFCILLVVLISFIVLKSLNNAMKQKSLFARLAASAIAVQFAMQSIINLAVNLNLMPPKGMTLPFVSYGGTSMVAIAFGMGLMLALTRKNPQESLKTSLPTNRSE